MKFVGKIRVLQQEIRKKLIRMDHYSARTTQHGEMKYPPSDRPQTTASVIAGAPREKDFMSS